MSALCFWSARRHSKLTMSKRVPPGFAAYFELSMRLECAKPEFLARLSRSSKLQRLVLSAAPLSSGCTLTTAPRHLQDECKAPLSAPQRSARRGARLRVQLFITCWRFVIMRVLGILCRRLRRLLLHNGLLVWTSTSTCNYTSAAAPGSSV